MKKKEKDYRQLTLFGLSTDSAKGKKSSQPKSKSPIDKLHVPTLKREDSALGYRAEKIIRIARDEGLRVDGFVVHDNIQTLASVDKRKNLRLQEIFLKADEKVLRSLFRIIGRKRRRGDSERVNQFITDNPPYKSLKGIPKSLLKDCYGPYGKYHDLNAILRRIMKTYTGQIDGIMITWRKASTGNQSITWASFRELGSGGLIRVNSLLDNRNVPLFVVESVIYHELCHAIVPAKAKGAQQVVHSKEFKSLMIKYPDFEKAERWKKQYFSRMLDK